ncbi:DUF4833 domain-containing protein [Dyadobacter sp. LHD-138]|nr:DUF4833 domain-containing protein [Dyadobacter sp. LHD-138]MDQ6477196.1 DUF4833 domain-containing protein [Dyadobacter sp. LHD-138]
MANSKKCAGPVTLYSKRSEYQYGLLCAKHAKGRALDQKDPIDIFWMKYADDGKKQKLNAFQREFGYGLSATAMGVDSFMIKAVAFPNRLMQLNKNEQSKYVVQIKINGQICELKRVYIRIVGGTALSPEIEYIEFYGLNLKTHRPVRERVDIR